MKIHSKNHKYTQQSNAILLQLTITCSKSTKSMLEQCMDDTDSTFFSSTSTDHCLLNNLHKKCKSTSNQEFIQVLQLMSVLRNRGKSDCKAIIIATGDLEKSLCRVQFVGLFNIFKVIKQLKMTLKKLYS